MKRIRCPKCNNYIVFDETKYQGGKTLVFQCTECGKQFGIKLKEKMLEALLSLRMCSITSKNFRCTWGIMSLGDI